MSARRLCVLVWHMPQDGAYGRLLEREQSKSHAKSVSDLDAFFGALGK